MADDGAIKWTVARNDKGQPIGCANISLEMMKFTKLRSAERQDLKDYM